ncbi:hypothetical protein [Xanthomonas euvesicatoria]|uniref:Uncharacterized protein n=1 Tax=Xanthomonas euvesicatoria TaxID=456327 RepID=A0AAW3UCF5_XANEU|nr:hypothetical protein [Xanthomonas euvesicatoria]MBB4725714.1 hypothetical protein [Xanthomonas euvesicatoria]MBB4872388.1 hypothetical protein [Xanthomonas euvesicatoria]
MKPNEFWKNFRLGEELAISGNFIYDGLRRFHEMQRLDYDDELFDFLYHVSVGLERLTKIAIVLCEHTDATDQDALEKSLITHNLNGLISRLKKSSAINLGTSHNELISILTIFYNSLRYDRFTLASSFSGGKERKAIVGWLEKYLKITLDHGDKMFGIDNPERCREFVRKTILKISQQIYEVIQRKARRLNLYTYELRNASKAQSVFLREVDIADEDVLWKELLIFFMNTRSTSGYLRYLRGIEPLDFDPALADEYLACFASDSAKARVMDELEHLYSEIEGGHALVWKLWQSSTRRMSPLTTGMRARSAMKIMINQK